MSFWRYFLIFLVKPVCNFIRVCISKIFLGLVRDSCLFFLYGSLATSLYAASKICNQVKGINNVVAWGNNNLIHLTPNKDENFSLQPIYSELSLPQGEFLLKRAKNLKMIQQIRRDQKDISIVVITGIGGIGKTTLARLWAQKWGKKYPKTSIWEINAETLSSLEISFQEMASSLAQNKSCRSELKRIEQLGDSQERMKQRMFFIKSRLSKLSGWILIYDNVESFSTVFSYLPHDYKTWGRGQVIITTRNSHLGQTQLTTDNNVVKLEELSQEDTLTLFTYLRFKCDPSKLSEKERQRALKFLSHIPPFPLDIRIAAQYLSLYQLSYNEYLDQLKQTKEVLYKMQMTLLKETSSYTQTRNRIIELSLHRILNSNSHFKSLIYLISFIDSQNIPRDLLKQVCAETLVLQFIYELKKYSFITNESFRNKLYYFSIHRSTQDIWRQYVKNHLTCSQNENKILSKSIKEFIIRTIRKRKIIELQLAKNHSESFLKNDTYLTCSEKSLIYLELGNIYFHLGLYQEAEKLLTANLQKEIRDPQVKARAFIHLGIIKRELRGYEEARKLIEEAILLLKRSNSINYEEICQAQTYLAYVYRNLGDYLKSKIFLQDALFSYNHGKLQSPGYMVEILYNLGNIYRALGDYDQSNKFLQKALNTASKFMPHDKQMRAKILVYLGKNFASKDENKKAIKWLEESVQIYKKIFSKTHVDVGWAILYLAECYNNIGQHKKAYNLAIRTSLIYKKNLRKDHAAMGILWEILGNIQLNLNHDEEAHSLFKKSLHIYYKNFKHPFPISVAKVFDSLGKLYVKKNDLERAEHYLKKSLIVYERLNHPHTTKILKSLSFLRIALAHQRKNVKKFLYYKNKTLECLPYSLKKVASPK